MSLKIKIIILLSLIVAGSSFGYFYAEIEAEKITLLNAENEYIAGETIQLNFNNIDEDYKLYLHHSYSKIVLKPEIAENKGIFSLPEFLSSKSGELNWVLLKNEKTVKNR